MREHAGAARCTVTRITGPNRLTCPVRLCSETKHVAIDCEMVGVGSDGTRNALARCSIVNRNGHVLFDTYGTSPIAPHCAPLWPTSHARTPRRTADSAATVRPKEHITDYRTHVSGIEYKHIKNGVFSRTAPPVPGPWTCPPVPGCLHITSLPQERAASLTLAGRLLSAPTLDQIQEKVSTLLSGRVLVGHSVQHDLQVLLLDHPRKSTRDTSGYKPFRKLAKGRAPALRKLAKEILGPSCGAEQAGIALSILNQPITIICAPMAGAVTRHSLNTLAFFRVALRPSAFRHAGIQVQDGSHSSVEDAQVTMALYRSVQRDWEAQLRLRAKKGGRNGPSSHSATQQETPNTAG